jgi:predicted Zn-dependent protease
MRLSDIKPTDEELRLLLEAGFVLRTAGRIEEAGDIFRGVKELLPESDVPLVALGSLELQKGRPEAAQELCEEALVRRPDSLYARLHRAEAMLLQQNRAEAEDELRAVIAADPASPHSQTAQALLDAVHLICPTEQ